jgi:hypothetical protein
MTELDNTEISVTLTGIQWGLICAALLNDRSLYEMSDEGKKQLSIAKNKLADQVQEAIDA